MSHGADRRSVRHVIEVLLLQHLDEATFMGVYGIGGRAVECCEGRKNEVGEVVIV